MYGKGDSNRVTTFSLVNKGRIKEILFLYYHWCDFYKRMPVDDDDFLDGLDYIEVSNDLKEDSYKKAIQKRNSHG